MRFAVRRTPRARGRIKRLIVSIIIRTGIRRVGVPSGRRWPKEWVGWVRIPRITVANHSGTAKPMFMDSCVVGVKVYGRRPAVLSVIRKSIKDVRSTAHLWPAMLIGRKICWAN